MLLAAACGGDGERTITPPHADTARYRNPVLDADFPDPAIVRAADGTFYAYATQTVRGGLVNIQVARSADLVRWALLGDALPQRPAWSTRVWNFWAPHVVRDDARGRYVMYYAAHHDALDGKCIGIATSPAPRGPFADIGAPLVCAADGFNIDAMAFDDPVSGRRFLYWGSSDRQPLVVQELAADGMSFAPGSAPRAVLAPGGDAEYSRLVEAPWVIHRAPWYYLFYSGDDCCGSPPHYAVLVARATDPAGPFQRLGAPGHNAVVADDAGADWIVYHAVDPARPLQDEVGFVRRPMLIDRLRYHDGWPVVEGGEPSVDRVARPVIARSAAAP
jgi:arabinan endo-1,5-alpha-L-arabinosidase